VLAAPHPLVAAESRWVEVTSPHFVVRSDAGDKVASRVARQFEVFRAALRELWPWADVDPPAPLLVYAARNEATLRGLLPSLPERTSGVFLSRGDRHVIALRTDLPVPRAGEGSPFHVLYHEYTHFVLDQGFPDLPAWLHEGLAEYLSASLVEDDGIEIGRSIPWHRLLLHEGRLMPLEELLAISRSSPAYDEGDRADLFYAESWALVHFLMQPERENTRGLSAYLERRRDGLGDDETTRELFGGAASLQRGLEGYVRGRFISRRLSIRLSAADEPSSPRALGPAETAAARAEVLIAADHLVDARALLEAALAIEPGSAPALQVLAGLGPSPPPRAGPDDPDAVLEHRCEWGMARDCVELGERYQGQGGHPIDLARAARLFVAGCAGDEKLGCAREGWAREQGEGLVLDPAGAAVAYGRACDAGHDWSCTRLGLLHELGQGVPRDTGRALALYAATCARGFAAGCTRQGVVHLSRGTPGEAEVASSWLRRGCDGHDAEGCALLAALYDAGQGVPRDPSRAAELRRRACAGGFDPSCEKIDAQP